MKSTERHRLKENEVASTVARAREAYEQYQTPIVAAGLAVVALIVAVVAVVAWRSRVDAQSRVLLADAMAVERAQVAPAPAPGAAPTPKPPAGSYPTEKARDEAALAKFVATADGYPSSEAGVAARYHAAGMLAALGRPAEAEQRYQEVVDRAGTSVYGQMAKLGLAGARVANGKFDQAIAVYREMAAVKDGPLPVDAVLMQLARAYDAAGKQSDARQTFRRIVDEFPQSPYAADARRALDQSKG